MNDICELSLGGDRGMLQIDFDTRLGCAAHTPCPSHMSMPTGVHAHHHVHSMSTAMPMPLAWQDLSGELLADLKGETQVHTFLEPCPCPWWCACACASDRISMPTFLAMQGMTDGQWTSRARWRCSC